MRAPVFQTVLGKDWHRLGSIVREHYSLTPQSNEYVVVEGLMHEIYHSNVAKFLIPAGLLVGAIVPYRATSVPTLVHYRSELKNNHLYWHRIFEISPTKQFHFRSFMKPVGENRVIEYVRFGVGIRLKVTVEDGTLVFRDRGYIWTVFGLNVPIPGRMLLGRAYVEERPIDENRFSMKLELRHPIFGRLFYYSGEFSITERSN